MNHRKKIIVVGGGFCGARVAQKLQKSFDVTLIDTKGYFEYTPGILRTIVEPNHFKKIQAKHTDYLPKATVIREKVLRVTQDKVYTKSKTLSFDYLVIAAGSRYTPPIKEQGVISATRAEILSEQHHKIHHAESILIIGGGLVGVELAAEIVDHYPDKKITIVHSRATLIDRNHPRSIHSAQQFLKKKGVTIIYNEKVMSKKGNTYITDKGTKIEADAAFICSGIVPNFELLQKNFKSLLDEKNQAHANKYLQLNDYPNIFIGGDLSSTHEEKTAQSAERHADYIIHNIRALEKNKPLKEYVSKRRPMIISLGKRYGIFEHKKLVFSGRIPAILKSYVEWKTMRKYR